MYSEKKVIKKEMQEILEEITRIIVYKNFEYKE